MKNDVIIIGAGIVGLATGVNLIEKHPGIKVLILEKEGEVAAHQTGHNSGVIHSGIYYKPGSLKATNCRRGYRKLINFCNENEIEYDLCGKVIVATRDDELPYLETLYKRGAENGLENLKLLTSGQIKEREPHVNGLEGIFVPQTGIINYTTVAEKYADFIRTNGGEIIFNSEVKGITEKSDSVETITANDVHVAKYVISCAGLQSDKVGKMTNPKLPVKIIPFRGEYYKIKEAKKHLVGNLIYPVPDPNFPFLGVHFTRMIDGAVEAGPNAVLAFKREGYKKTDFNFNDTVETFTWPGFIKVAKKYTRMGLGEFYRSYYKPAFVKALQRLIPEITGDDLEPGGSGIRAQACDRYGGLLDDFYIEKGKRVIHVLNAPSPAATASLAIGETIASYIDLN
jgi:L-2-hydroxyglutarate oxidase